MSLTALSVITAIFLAVFIGAPLYYLDENIKKEAKCIKHERKLVKSAAWNQPIHIGKVTTYVLHPAREEMRSVCVEYAE